MDVNPDRNKINSSFEKINFFLYVKIRNLSYQPDIQVVMAAIPGSTIKLLILVIQDMMSLVAHLYLTRFCCSRC